MTVYVVDLEAVETRYTGQWKNHIPKLLRDIGHTVEVIDGGEDIPAGTTPGAFLNFGGTNIYKARQVEKIGRLFCEGKIQPYDQFLFTDAWHPGIINLKYMADLLCINIEIHGLWHAGSYDPEDFLGRMIGHAEWVRHAEKSFFNAIDYNYFASDFHIKMFSENLFKENEYWSDDMINQGKIIRTGWPFEFLAHQIKSDSVLTDKKNLIVFPHRIAPEKQVEIFKDLAASMPEYEWVVCQELGLNKQEYHQVLASAKIVFSANLQETLGISCYEGALAGAIPMVPDRLSYTEMYSDNFKYPSEWTESDFGYQTNKEKLMAYIRDTMENYSTKREGLNTLIEKLSGEYFNSNNLLNNFPSFKLLGKGTDKTL